MYVRMYACVCVFEYVCTAYVIKNIVHVLLINSHMLYFLFDTHVSVRVCVKRFDYQLLEL